MPYPSYGSRITKQTKPTNQQSSPLTSSNTSAFNPTKPVPPAGAKPFPPPENTTPIKKDLEETMAVDNQQQNTDEGSEKSDMNKIKVGKVKKKAKQKFSKIEKKHYINARLRRMISPKPPVQILQELAQQEQAVVSYSFLDPITEGQMQLFRCEVDVSGSVFSGTGPSKQIAKNIAAEGAIHAFISGTAKTEELNKVKEDIADKAPWSAMASLALFKLFNDWQSLGYSLPQQFMATPPPMSKNLEEFTPQEQEFADHNTSTNKLQSPSFKMKPAKMPADPTSKHPVMLLNELHPRVSFQGTLGVLPGNLFGMNVEIDGRAFQGAGKSKKDAKKACAIAALKALHEIEYKQTETH